MHFISNPDTPLLRLSRRGDYMSTRDACGIHFWGLAGSGKTTSAQMLAGAFLRAGYGAYVTAAKPEVISQWLSYAQKHGRSNSIILLNENEGFNFLEYEMARHGMDGIGTVVECLMRVIDASRRASGTASQRGGEVFWEDSARNTLRYSLPPLYSAKGALTIPDILRFITTAPTSPEQAANREWQQNSFMFRMLKLAAEQPKVRMTAGGAAKRRQLLEGTMDCDSRRRRAGTSSSRITAALDRFNHGRLNRFFCGKTTVVPEMSFHGAVLVDAKPTLTWNEDGAIAQQLFKFIWQRAVLNRNSLEQKHRERPSFLWSDESQETVAPYDGEFLGLSRESKCCTVYLTQSLPTYFAKIGGDNPRDAALSLASKFKTHVFCANNCPETNEFASRMIGKVLTRRSNFSAGQLAKLKRRHVGGQQRKQRQLVKLGFLKREKLGLRLRL